MKFVRFKNKDRRGYYYETENNSQELSFLSTLFDDHGMCVDWVIKELINPNSRGISGELIDMRINGDTIKLSPLLVPEEYENYYLEIDKNLLLELLNKWQELVKKRVDEIIFIQENDKIYITDHMPN